MIRVAINGFGRIGRRVTRLILNHPQIQLVAINDKENSRTLSHLFKYDSIHGVWSENVTYTNNAIVVNGLAYPLLNEKHPSQIDWNPFKPDVVLECSGKFKSLEDLNFHLKNGSKKAILSVPPEKDDIKMVVLGVNDFIVDWKNDTLVSNASCTTNSAAPMLSLLDKNFGIEQAYITTIHSYTTDQKLHDTPHHDLRRARAAGQSIVPTTTGAAKALTKIFPHLKNVIGGCGIRVPVPNGSLTDITCHVSEQTTVDEINHLFKQESLKPAYNNILEYTTDPIVSIDILGNPNSCIFDAQMTSVIGKMIKIIGWYDNETGYSSRLVDLIIKFSSHS